MKFGAHGHLYQIVSLLIALILQTFPQTLISRKFQVNGHQYIPVKNMIVEAWRNLVDILPFGKVTGPGQHLKLNANLMVSIILWIREKTGQLV